MLARSARSLQERLSRLAMFLVSPVFLEGAAAVFLVLAILFLTSGCQTEPVRPVVQTVVVDRPVPILCKIAPVIAPAWETLRANPSDPVTVSRAIRAELEQARGLIIQLEAAARACQ